MYSLWRGSVVGMLSVVVFPLITECADGRDAIEFDCVPTGPDRRFRHVLAVLVRAPAALDKLRVGAKVVRRAAAAVGRQSQRRRRRWRPQWRWEQHYTSVVNPSGKSVVESDAAFALSRDAGRRCHVGRWTVLRPRNALAEGSMQNATSANAAAATERLAISVFM